MSNVESRTKTIQIIEVIVPNPATRRDMADLLRVADAKYRETNTDDPHITNGQDLYDDAYMIEARDDEIVASIKVDPS